MNNEEIKEIIQLLLDSGIHELEVERNGNRVRVVRDAVATVSAAVPAIAATPVAAPAAAAPIATAPAPVEENLLQVKSPIVGTFYESPSPDSPPFVSIGDAIQPGKVLCIVESMKLMNEIESELSGTIVARHVQNGQPVEYGAVLFSVRPN